MSEQLIKMDINSVNPEELMTFPGIGPQIADRILAARPFTDLEDMRRVEGIGLQILERLEPYVTFSQPTTKERVQAGVSSVKIKPPSEGEATAREGEAGQVGEARLKEILISSQDENPITTAEESVGKAAAANEKEPALKTEELPDVDSQPARETKIPVEKHPKRTVSRGEVWLMVIGSGALAFILALVLSLGVLAGINGGLRFVRPVELTQLSQRVDGLNAQTKTLQQDIQGLQTRIDNLEALSGRVSAVEQQSKQLKAEVDKTNSQVETLNSKVSELSTNVQTLQNQVGVFQTFLNGLRDLLDGLKSP